MEYYFEDVREQERLKIILESWLDPPTPFRHHCGVKGLGCDCIHFVARVYEEIGILKWRKDLIEDYPRDWHLHNTRERLSEAIEKELNIEKIELSQLMNGDIVLSHYGKAASHAAIFFNGYLYQAINEVGVRKIHIDDPVFSRQIKYAYRIKI